jgi:hypothetical protein
MATCLTQAQANRVQAAMDRKEFDIDALAEVSTEARKTQFAKYMDKEAVEKFNRNFEERIITASRDNTDKLKNLSADELAEAEAKIATRQRKLLQSFVEREIASDKLPKASRADIVNRIGKVQHMLDDVEMRGVLKDLVSHKLGVGVTTETMEELATIGRKATEARAALSKEMLDTQKRVAPIYKSRPEVAKQIEEANKLSGAEKKNALKEIDADANNFANQVFNGVVKEDGTSKFTKAELKEVMKPRLEMSKDIEHLSQYMNDLHRSMETTKLYEVSMAEGSYSKMQVLLRMAGEALYETFAFGKSVVASMDFSYLLRQGWQTAFTNPKMLFKNAGLAGRDAFSTMMTAKREAKINGKLWNKVFAPFENNVYDFARLEINTRANALNGIYSRAENGYGLNIFKEEQFPSSLAERVPVLGRLFKASEVGYNSLALRMRADLADTFVSKMQKTIDPKTGEMVDMYAKENADALGLLVGSMTGRGLPFGVRAFEKMPDKNWLNATFFSPRFVGSQFYTLQAPFKWAFNKNDPIAKLAGQKAAQAFVEVAGMIFMINMIGETFWDEAIVDTNPKSKNFGYIRYGDYAWDMTGAHGSVIALVGSMWDSRNGKSYDARLDIYKDSIWAQDTIDIGTNWLLNKTSPTASIIKEFINGKNFGEDEFSWSTAAKNILTPLTISISAETLMKDPTSADAYLVILGELIGIPSKDMSITPRSKDWKELEAASPELHRQAVRELNTQLFKDVERLRTSSQFQNLPREEQDKEILKTANAQKRDTVDKYMKQVK